MRIPYPHAFRAKQRANYALLCLRLLANPLLFCGLIDAGCDKYRIAKLNLRPIIPKGFTNTTTSGFVVSWFTGVLQRLSSVS